MFIARSGWYIVVSSILWHLYYETPPAVTKCYQSNQLKSSVVGIITLKGALWCFLVNKQVTSASSVSRLNALCIPEVRQTR